MIEKIQEIVKNAGQMMLNRKDIKIEQKGSVANLVTNMDKNNQKYIIDKLSKIYPDAIFFAEEKENESLTNEYTFVIDPIDGTTNFAYDYKFSSISVGLVKNMECILAVCYNPYLDEMFIAQKGKGAYLNGIKIEVSDNTLENSLVNIGTSPYNKEFASQTFNIAKEIYLKSKDIRRTGSAVLDICYVACSRVDGFFEKRLSFWDYCAASLVLTEAKGKYRIIDGEFVSKNPVTLIAGNENNIEEIEEIYRKYESATV